MLEKNDVTIYDIAAALDISPSTVSRALSGVPLVRKETRKKILATASQMGYRQNFFASKLRSKRTKILGAVVHRLNTATASALISAVEYTARRNDYSLIVTQTSEDHEAYSSAIQHLNHHRVDGMLICNMQSKFSGSATLRYESPAVIIEKATLARDAVEAREIAYKFTKHLLNKGCKNIVLIHANANTSNIEDVSLGCRMAIAKSESSGCCLTIQTKDEMLADKNATPVNLHGIIYIGQILGMLFIPNDELYPHVNGIGIFDDTSDNYTEGFSVLGDFAAEVLLSLLRIK